MGTIRRTMRMILLATLLWQGTVMADNSDYLYYAHVHTQGSAWSLRVNDIFVRDNLQVPYADFSPNIGTKLRSGENTLSLLFSPVTGQDPGTGEYTYALNDGVEIDIAIERYQWATQQQERIHLVRMRFNEEDGKFEHLEKTAGGEERVTRQPHLRTDARPRLSAFENIIFTGGWSIDGYRLDISFTLTDPIPPFHWEHDAVVLEDTPRLRRELREAYRHLHGLIARNDTEAVFREVEPVWARTAYMLTEHSSAREFADNTRNGLATFERVKPDGAVLQPLNWGESPQQDQVELMAEGRLVRLQPHPIIWERPPAGSERYSSFPVVFYKTRDGQWRVAGVLTNP